MSSGGWVDLAHTILTAAAECLNANTANGAPEQQYVGHQLPATDCCDQLVVWLTQAIPVAGSQVCAAPATLLFNVRVLRPCQPGLKENGDPPTAEEMETAAAEMLVDIKVLWCCLLDKIAEATDNNTVRILGATPFPTQGLCAGWTLSIGIDDDDCCLEDTE